MPDRKLHAVSISYNDAATGRSYIITRCAIQVGAKSTRLFSRDDLKKLREAGSQRVCGTCLR